MVIKKLMEIEMEKQNYLETMTQKDFYLLMVKAMVKPKMMETKKLKEREKEKQMG